MKLDLIKGAWWGILHPKITWKMGVFLLCVGVVGIALFSVLCVAVLGYLLLDPVLREISFREVWEISPFLCLGWIGPIPLFCFLGMSSVAEIMRPLHRLVDLHKIDDSVEALSIYLGHVRSIEFTEGSFIDYMEPNVDLISSDSTVPVLRVLRPDGGSEIYLWMSGMRLSGRAIWTEFHDVSDLCLPTISLYATDEEVISSMLYAPIINEIFDAVQTPDILLSTALRKL